MPDYAKTLYEELLLDGRVFTDEVNIDATSLDYLIRNPADSGVDVVTFTVSVTHADDLTVTVYDDVSNVSGGTTEDGENNFVGHPRTDEVALLSDPTFNGNNEHSSISYLGAGTRDVLQGRSMALKPGEDVLISMADDTGSAKTMSLLATWGEMKEGSYR